MNILTTPLSQLTDVTFDCECGKTHSIKIGSLLIGDGVSSKVAEAAEKYLPGPILVVCDIHTDAVLGNKVAEDLKAAGAKVDKLVFEAEHLHPDATTLGRLLIEASDETKNYNLLIAVGSGTLNDVTRLVSGRLEKPYFIVGTAPSMDGYAGYSSPIVCRGSKISFYSHYADAIVADTAIMAQAPSKMMAAGLGDILGKYVSLADWKLGHDLKDEYRCELISQFMGNAVEKCAASVDGLAARSPEATQSMAEALILSGMAMGLAGVTRPASGCEHHMTHFCDIELIGAGMDYPLHGNSVGISAIAMLRFYEFARRDGLTDIMTPPAEHVRDLIKKINGPVKPCEIGISDELFRRAMMEAMYLRPQYSMLKHVAAHGKLEEYTEAVMEEMKA